MSETDTPLVLIIDDQEIMLQFCERMLAGEFCFLRAADAAEARLVLARRPDVAGVLLDRDFSRADPANLVGPAHEVRREGLYILRWLRADHAELPILMVTGHRDQAAALDAAELHADYLVWSDVEADAQLLLSRLRLALRTVSSDVECALHAFHACGVVGEAPAFRRMLVSLYRVVFGDRPILMLGETGCGKDLLAKAVHQLSRGHTRPFINVNVAALSSSLAESELFGHERHAFTGAERARFGQLRSADGGTLFLNEIADLALDLQAKLLSALEQREVVPVGGDRPVPTQFRLIAATSRDLRGLVETGKFRRDLYYRLAWNTFEIPPLRERREDIDRLVGHFFQQVQKERAEVTSITCDANAHLQSLPWAGNVRQLQGVVEAACAAADYAVTLKDVHEAISRQERSRPKVWAAASLDQEVLSGAAPRSGRQPDPLPDRAALEDVLFAGQDFESIKRRYIDYLLRQTGNNVGHVAEVSGIGRTTLFEWLRRWRENDQAATGRGGPAANDHSG